MLGGVTLSFSNARGHVRQPISSANGTGSQKEGGDLKAACAEKPCYFLDLK